eukprot:3444550-Prymnesium_polylepis.1
MASKAAIAVSVVFRNDPCSIPAHERQIGTDSEHQILLLARAGSRLITLNACDLWAHAGDAPDQPLTSPHA